jgi:hypothetical protein
MDREGFLDTLKRQYADEIHEAYVMCESRDGEHVDLQKLHALMMQLARAAGREGLPQSDFLELAYSALPPEVGDQLHLNLSLPKAA